MWTGGGEAAGLASHVFLHKHASGLCPGQSQLILNSEGRHWSQGLPPAEMRGWVLDPAGVDRATWVNFVLLAPHPTHPSGPSDWHCSQILPLSPSSRCSVSSAKVGQSVNSTLPAIETAPEMEEANSSKSQVLGGKKWSFLLQLLHLRWARKNWQMSCL